MSDRWNDNFMRKRRFLAWRGPIIAQAIYDEFKPKSFIDVGCSIGDIAKGMLDLDVDSYGLEFTQEGKEYYKLPEDRYIYTDITRPHLRLSMKFDLLLCLEVFSIIDFRHHDSMKLNLVNLSDKILVNHIDEIPGYIEKPEVAKRICSKLEPLKRKPAIKAFYYSIKYFERKNETTRIDI
jgi:hypothetical protein